MKPEELLDPGTFPDELKWVPAHYKLHPDDPVYLLLAWHWQRIQRSEDTLKAAVVEFKTVLDGRITGMTQAVDAVAALEEAIEGVQEAMEAKPAQWEARLQEPLKGAIGQAKALQQVLAPLTDRFQEARRREVLAVFVVGVCLGVLGSLVLFLR